MKINIGKVLLGGIVAGIVANGIDYVIGKYLMAEDAAEMQARLNLNAAALESSFVTWIVVDFVWGILLVFPYAAMRSRFGPGPKTAVVSGATLWLGVTATMAGLSAMGIFTQAAFLKSAALYFVSTMAASLAGAALYKE